MNKTFNKAVKTTLSAVNKVSPVKLNKKHLLIIILAIVIIMVLIPKLYKSNFLAIQLGGVENTTKKNKEKLKSGEPFLYSRIMKPKDFKNFIEQYRDETNPNCKKSLLPNPKNINRENMKSLDCVLQTLSLLFPLEGDKKQYDTLTRIRDNLQKFSKKADSDPKWKGLSHGQIKNFLKKSYEGLYGGDYDSLIFYNNTVQDQKINKTNKIKFLKMILNYVPLNNNNDGYIIPFTVTGHMLFLYYYKENNIYHLKLIDLQIIATDLNCNRCNSVLIKQCGENLENCMDIEHNENDNTPGFFFDPIHNSFIQNQDSKINNLVEIFIDKMEQFDEKSPLGFVNLLHTTWAFFLYFSPLQDKKTY